jgi:hypothetical protein
MPGARDQKLALETRSGLGHLSKRRCVHRSLDYAVLFTCDEKCRLPYLDILSWRR